MREKTRQKLDLLRRLFLEVERLGTMHPRAVYIQARMKPCQYNSGRVEEEGELVGIGCIFGQAIAKIDKRINPLMEGRSIEYVLLKGYGIGSTFPVNELSGAQASQDHGATWGECLRNIRGWRERLALLEKSFEGEEGHE